MIVLVYFKILNFDLLLFGAYHHWLLYIGTLIDGQPIIELPPKTIHLSKVEFSSEERAFYTKLEADSRNKFKVHSLSFYIF